MSVIRYHLPGILVLLVEYCLCTTIFCIFCWVTPKSWLTGWHLKAGCSFGILFFFLREPLLRMMEKVPFSWFSNVFQSFRPCERMRSLVEIHNIRPFSWFSNVFHIFHRANACASMHLLVEIHNIRHISSGNGTLLYSQEFGLP